MTSTYNRVAGQSIERVAALSDGLFAIALTLIVLEIHVPGHEGLTTEAALAGALQGLLPRVVTYLLSFLTLGIFWVGQQVQLHHLARTNRSLTWIHLVFLAAVATMPFSTELLAEFITFRLALLLYWGNVLLLGLILLAGWTYAGRAALIDRQTPPEAVRAICRRIVVAQTLYAVGAALCVVSTYWSLGFIVLVQLNYAIAPRIPGLSRLTS
jgi:uncharacterized membrane protein